MQIETSESAISEKLKEEYLASQLAQGLADVEAGRVISADEVFNSLFTLLTDQNQ